jgi:hypothetical protein
MNNQKCIFISRNLNIQPYEVDIIDNIDNLIYKYIDKTYVCYELDYRHVIGYKLKLYYGADTIKSSKYINKRASFIRKNLIYGDCILMNENYNLDICEYNFIYDVIKMNKLRKNYIDTYNESIC